MKLRRQQKDQSASAYTVMCQRTAGKVNKNRNKHSDFQLQSSFQNSDPPTINTAGERHRVFVNPVRVTQVQVCSSNNDCLPANVWNAKSSKASLSLYQSTMTSFITTVLVLQRLSHGYDASVSESPWPQSLVSHLHTCPIRFFHDDLSAAG